MASSIISPHRWNVRRSSPEKKNQPKTSVNAGFKYAAVCFLFFVTLTIGAIFNESSRIERIFYQLPLFIICSAPYFLGSKNPHHRLLAIFMVSYYFIFGMSDFFDILLGINTPGMFAARQSLQGAAEGLTKSDWIVIVGAISFLSGYFLLYKFIGNRRARVLVKDWKPGVIFGIALVSWILGFTFSVAYDMVVTPMHIPTHVLGIPLGIASNLRFFSPLASLMLIYLITREYRLKLLWTLLIFIILTEFVLGFFVNSKEISYRIPALLLVGLYYLRGSLDKKILIFIAVSLVPYLLFFDAYRFDVLMGARNQNQVQALQAFDKNAAVIMKNVSKVKNVVGTSLSGLKDRINGKVYVDIIVSGTDSGRVHFQEGETLVLFFKTFIPRMFWPEKPASTTGQLFNMEFHLSESRYTFVPSTQLGELYWNFGTIGVIFGMIGIGVFFGYLASAFSLGKVVTLPRFMVLLLATYYLAIRFEANIALQYSTFIRLVFLIVLIDFFVIKFFGLYQRGEKMGAAR